MALANQPTIIGGSEEPPLQTPVTIIPTYQTVVRSCPVIGFGTVLLLLSVMSTLLSAWFVQITSSLAAVISLGCGITFLVLSLLTIYGGADVSRRQGTIVFCLVFGILGLFTAVASIVVSILTIQSYEDSSHGAVGVHVCMMSFAAFEGLAALILTIYACCNDACSCCFRCYARHDTSGHVLMSPLPPVSA